MAPLTDRSALLAHRDKATADFLQVAADDEIQERLKEVNRTFTNTAIVTGMPEIWESETTASILKDEDVLALEESSQDLIVHAMSLHWANDPVGQMVQCRRALRPDGLFLATLFGGQTLHELRSALAEAEVRLTGGLSPRILPMGEVRDLGGLLQRAGFALPVADVTPLTVTYESPLHLMRDLRAMGENNALAARRRTFTPKSLLLEAVRIYIDSFGTPDGRIPATFEIITLTGWAPSADQPQPLRPGSATNRLADALKVPEFPLKRSND